MITPGEAPSPTAVLVAGGTGGLGTAVVGALLAAGRPVTATWLHESARDGARAELGAAAALTLVRADLTEPAEVEATVAGVERLGAVVNLVGGYRGGANVHETVPADFDSTLRLNLRPGFLLARAAMPRLVEAGGGSFVAVSARAAVRPFPGAAGYITAKAGVIAFVQALDAEYRQLGVRSNALLPNVIDTPANREAMPDADRARWTPPERIAEVVAFLVSDASAAVSGAAVPV